MNPMDDTTPGPARKSDVGIYKITKGFDVWIWLCRKHLAARKDDGWSVQDRRKVIHALTCDDCVAEAVADTKAMAGELMEMAP